MLNEPVPPKESEINRQSFPSGEESAPTAKKKTWFLQEVNPGWVVIAILVGSYIVYNLPGVTSKKLLVSTCILVCLILVILFFMRNFEIVVSPQEVKDKEAARKQTQIVLAVAGLIIMLALIAQKLGFGS